MSTYHLLVLDLLNHTADLFQQAVEGVQCSEGVKKNSSSFQCCRRIIAVSACALLSLLPIQKL
jgi:hypothetical protein